MHIYACTYIVCESTLYMCACRCTRVCKYILIHTHMEILHTFMYTLIMYQYKTSSILGELPHTRQKSLLFSLPAGAMNAIISVSTFGGVRSAIGNVCMQYVHSTDSLKIGKNRKKGATLLYMSQRKVIEHVAVVDYRL